MALNRVHTALDVAGFAGPVGPFADTANAALHAAQGNYGDAALSAVALVPAVGDGIKGSAMLAKRAEDIHSALDPIAQSRKTTAVATTADGQTLVASSDDLVPKSQRDVLNNNETAVRGVGHAEETLINAADELGTSVTDIGVSRPMCEDCQQAVEAFVDSQ